MKLDGFGIFVKDMATMVRFYRDILNFEIREDEDASNRREEIWKFVQIHTVLIVFRIDA